MKPLLKDLGLEAVNAGTWASDGGWLEDASAPLIQSVDPASGATIGSVRATTAAQYEQVMSSARAVAEAWRRVPAPKRGEAVRLVGEELRLHKSALGSLVTLEMGKIKAEGDGAVAGGERLRAAQPTRVDRALATTDCAIEHCGR